MSELPPGDSAGAIIAAMQILFAIIGTVAIALRIVAKHLRARSYQTHDYLCLFAYVRQGNSDWKASRSQSANAMR